MKRGQEQTLFIKNNHSRDKLVQYRALGCFALSKTSTARVVIYGRKAFIIWFTLSALGLGYALFFLNTSIFLQIMRLIKLLMEMTRYVTQTRLVKPVPIIIMRYEKYPNRIITVLKKVNVSNRISSIWCWDSNSRPLEPESPPMTTRPVLLHIVHYSLFYIIFISFVRVSIACVNLIKRKKVFSIRVRFPCDVCFDI